MLGPGQNERHFKIKLHFKFFSWTKVLHFDSSFTDIHSGSCKCMAPNRNKLKVKVFAWELNPTKRFYRLYYRYMYHNKLWSRKSKKLPVLMAWRYDCRRHAWNNWLIVAWWHHKASYILDVPFWMTSTGQHNVIRHQWCQGKCRRKHSQIIVNFVPDDGLTLLGTWAPFQYPIRRLIHTGSSLQKNGRK